MAITDNTQNTTLTETVTNKVENDIKTAPVVDDDSTESIVSDTESKDPKPFEFQQEISDSDKATLSKSKQETTGNDFYDAFIKKQMEFDTIKDLQSADTYWKNRPEERKVYEEKYGDKAREEFDKTYSDIESAWRVQIEKDRDRVALNERYDWMFGEGDDKLYETNPSFGEIHAISTGEKRIGDLLTDKSITDIDAALTSKTYMNDRGELVKLNNDEKWWTFAKGEGTSLDTSNPRHKSSDNREIVGFEEVNFGPEYRGDRYVKAIYEGDIPKGNIISVWDTTAGWILKGDKLRRSGVGALGMTLVKTPINLAADLITSAIGLANSVAVLTDKDDENAFSDWANKTVVRFKSRKISSSERDKAKTWTVPNTIDFVANTAMQLYSGASFYKGANKLISVFLAKNPLLMEAKALEAAGDIARAGRKYIEFDAKYGKYASGASLFGMTLMTGDSVITEARQAGFSEKETASIYGAYLVAMLGANRISQKMIERYLTNGAAKGVMDQLAKKYAIDYAGATAETKLVGAKNMVSKAWDAIRALPATASHSPLGFKAATVISNGLNEALEEEAEWLGQEVVEHAATLISKYTHDKDAPKFDTIMDEGYFARQLPIIAMNALGGFVGGAMVHYLPGMAHNNEQSFLVKGDDEEKLIKIALMGGETEKLWFESWDRTVKSGKVGSPLLSVKINEKTGDYYKMTDPEAVGTMSHAEATDRAVKNQYAVYKAMYGSANATFDDLVKSERKGDKYILDQITSQDGHVFHKVITKLHKDRKAIISEINPDPQKPVPGDTKAKKDAEAKKQKEDTKTAADNIKNPPANNSVVTSPIEDPKVTADNEAKYKEQFNKEVIERAELFGTKNYGKVAELIEIDRQIEDILSGAAAVEQVAMAVARNQGIDVFNADEQKKIFSSQVDSKGNPIENKYAKLGDKLLRAIFEADTKLAKDHSETHMKYAAASEKIVGLLNGAFDSTVLDTLYNAAVKEANSLAIDPNSSEIDKIDAGVNEMIDTLIPDQTLMALVLAARSKFGLTKSTRLYEIEIDSLYLPYIEKNRDAIEDEANGSGYLPNTYIRGFVEQPNVLDLLQKLAISRYIDKLQTNKQELLTASINRDLSRFKDGILNYAEGERVVTTDFQEGNQEEIDSKVNKLYKELVKKKGELDLYKKARPETPEEIFTINTAIQSLTSEIKELSAEFDSSKKGVASNSLPLVMRDIGALVLETIAKESESDELESVVGVQSAAIDEARQVINKYYTVLNNVAPVVPIIPKYGALHNLLNEISVTNQGVKSTLVKLIDDGITEDVVVKLPNGKTVTITQPPSKVQQLDDMRLRKNTPLEEFRELEQAKATLDAVNIRLGQVDLLAELSEKLSDLQKYIREHEPISSAKFNAIPKFLSEYVYDSERYDELNNQSVRTKEEQEEFQAMEDRKVLLFDRANPFSLRVRLLEAKEKLEGLIDLGVKSLSVEERSRIYKAEIAAHYNKMKNSLSDTVSISKMHEKLSTAINKFIAITDKYTDSDEDKLVKGKIALNEVYAEVYALSEEDKTAFFDAIFGGYKRYTGVEDKAYATPFLINAIATNNNIFEKHYNQVLINAKDSGVTIFPTISQEIMANSVFSFATDDTNSFQRIRNSTPGFFMVDGTFGAGKTTMVGYALAAVQSHIDERYAEMLGDKYTLGSKTRVQFAAENQRQADKIAKDCVALGVTSTQNNLDKQALFNQLKTFKADDWDSISMIVFDEATWIQGLSPDDEPSELQFLMDKLMEINKSRALRGLLPMKFLGIGDRNQGGWQEGLPSAIDEDYATKQIYSKLGKKRNFGDETGILTSIRLDYAFRTLCSKITETTKILGDVYSSYKSRLGARIGNLQNVTVNKIVASWGTIDNDERGRYGGVHVVNSNDKLYDDANLVANIKAQIDIENKLQKGQRNFKVLIVDDAIADKSVITGADNMAALYGQSLGLVQLIRENPEYFEFDTVKDCQGNEAMYVIANLTDVFPDLPVMDDRAAYNINRASTVINRARLYSKISVAPTVNMESANNSIVKMLDPKEANKYNDEWNDFYLTKYRPIGKPEASEQTKEEEEEDDDEEESEDSSTEESDDTKNEEPASATVPGITTKQEKIDTLTKEKELELANATTEDEKSKIDANYNAKVNTIVNEVLKDETVESGPVDMITSKDAEEAIIVSPGKAILTKESQIDGKISIDDNKTVIVNNAVVEETIPDQTKKNSRKESKESKRIKAFIDSNDGVVAEGKPNTDKKESDAKKMLRRLSELGYTFGYLKVNQNKPNKEQERYQALFASDLFGSNIYKETDREYDIRQSIKDETKALRKAILKMKGGIVPGYSFSLVSTQLYDPKIGSDTIVHLIYAKNDSTQVKLPVLMLPYTELDDNHDLVKTLAPIRELIQNTSEQMRKLSEEYTDLKDETGGFFGEFSDRLFGNVTEPMNPKTITRLFDEAGIPIKKFEFPILPKNTVISRVAMSGADGYRSTQRNPAGYYSPNNKKVSIKNKNIGLLFTETRLENVKDIFAAITAGQPDTDSEEAKSDYILFLDKNKDDRSLEIRTYPTRFSTEITPVIAAIETTTVGEYKDKFFTIKSFKGLQASLDNNTLQPTPNGKPIHKVTVGGNSYNVLLFKTNSRVIPVIFTVGKFSLFFGFDAKGTPIMGNTETTDMESAALIKALGSIKLTDTELNATNDYKESVDVQTMRSIMGSLMAYNIADVDEAPNSDVVLDLVSKQFINNKKKYFKDHKLSLGEFRKLMGDTGVQLSPALALKTTSNSGKSLIFYTNKTVDEIDLQNIDVLKRLTGYVKKVDLSKATPESLNIQAYTKEGIGILLLDSKYKSVTQLLNDENNTDRSEMIRATSPLRSATNVRMVALIKELTEIAHAAKGFTNLSKSAHKYFKDLHTRIDTLCTENGSPLVKIFSDESANKIMEMIRKNGKQEDYINLLEFLYSITADISMGRMVIEAKDVHPKIVEIFSIEKYNDRLDEYNRVKDDPQYKEVFAKYNFPADIGTFSIKGSYVIDKATKTRIVDNDTKNPIAYVPSSLTGAGTDAGSFDMVYFLQHMLVGYGDKAVGMGKLLDKFMSFSNPNTLRKGIPWTGAFVQSISKELGVLDETDANEQLQTTAKGIGLPAVVLNSKKLASVIDQYVSNTKETPKPQKSVTETPEQIASKFITNVDTFITTELEKVTGLITEPEIIALTNNVTRYIAEQISLYKMESLTTIGNEKRVKFEADLKNKVPSKGIIMRNTNAANFVSTIKTKTEDMTPADAHQIFMNELVSIDNGDVLMDTEEALIALRMLASTNTALKLDTDGYQKTVLEAIDARLHLIRSEPGAQSTSELVKQAFDVKYSEDDEESNARLDFILKTLDEMPLETKEQSVIATLFPKYKSDPNSMSSDELEAFGKLISKITTHIKGQPSLRNNPIDRIKTGEIIESWTNPC